MITAILIFIIVLFLGAFLDEKITNVHNKGVITVISFFVGIILGVSTMNYFDSVNTTINTTKYFGKDIIVSIDDDIIIKEITDDSLIVNIYQTSRVKIVKDDTTKIIKHEFFEYDTLKNWFANDIDVDTKYTLYLNMKDLK